MVHQEYPSMKLKLKTRARLVLAFLAIAAIGAVMGGMGIYSIGALSNQSARMMEENMAPLPRIFSLYEAVQHVQVLARDIVLARNASEIDALAAQIAEKDAFIQKETASLASDVQDDQLKFGLSTIMLIWGDFKVSLAVIVEEARKGKGLEVVSLMSQLMSSSGATLDSATKEILDGSMKNASAMLALNRDLAVRSSLLLLVMIVMGVMASVVLGLIISVSISKPLVLASEAAKEIAAGRLGISIDTRFAARTDELGDLAKALIGMAGHLNGGMRTIGASVEELGTVGAELASSMDRTEAALAEITHGVESVSRQSINQSASVEETAATVRHMATTIEGLDQEIEVQSREVSSSSASVEEMVGNIHSVANSVKRLGESFTRLLAASGDGRTKLEKVKFLIGEVASQSERLGVANSAVSGIASRTNLLAMNAAIEAAHAGDAGRGFAVVADEIRGLAENAAIQSKEIKKDITAILGSIGEAVVSSTVARDSFATVESLIEGMSQLEQEITLALEEQRQGSRQVLEALASITQVSAKVLSGSRELRVGSAAIGSEMDSLQSETLHLKESAEGIGRSMREIGSVAATVAALSSRNNSAISAVEGLLGHYVLADDAPSA